MLQSPSSTNLMISLPPVEIFGSLSLRPQLFPMGYLWSEGIYDSNLSFLKHSSLCHLLVRFKVKNFWTWKFQKGPRKIFQFFPKLKLNNFSTNCWLNVYEFFMSLVGGCMWIVSTLLYKTVQFTLDWSKLHFWSRINFIFLLSMCLGKTRPHAKFQVSSLNILSWRPVFVIEI